MPEYSYQLHAIRRYRERLALNSSSSSWQYLYMLGTLLNCHDCAVSSSGVVATRTLERLDRLRSRCN